MSTAENLYLYKNESCVARYNEVGTAPVIELFLRFLMQVKHCKTSKRTNYVCCKELELQGTW